MTRFGSKLVLAFAAVALLALHVQVFSHGDVPHDVATKQNPVPSSDSVLAKAKGNYEENCLMCHGEAGKGDGPMASMLKSRPSDLTDTKRLGGMSDGEIFWIVTKGVQPMPSFENKLPEEDRWGLVHMMRSLSKTKPNTTPSKH